MKKKIIIIISAILSALLIMGLIITIVILTSKKSPIVYTGTTSSESDEKLINDDTKTPDFYSSSEVVAMALWRVSNTNSFEITTTGSSKALITSIKINNKRTVINNKAIITCVSAGIISSGNQRYFIDDIVLIRNASKVKSDATAEFKDDSIPEALTNESYINRYGWMPYQVSGYIINNNTFLNEPTMVKNEDNTYSLSIDLDPNSEAAYYYKREVSTNAKAPSEPEFISIHLDMVIDENYYIKTLQTTEKYKIVSGDASFLGAVTTETSVLDTYNYEEIKFDHAVISYFNNYLDLEAK